MLVDLSNDALCEIEVAHAIAPDGVCEVLPALLIEWRKRMDKEEKKNGD